MKNTDFMNLSLPEGADKIDVEMLNNDFTTLENAISKHYVKQQIEVDGTATIIGSIGPYVQLENLTDNILNVSIGDELVILMKGDNRKIRTISGENYGVVTNGAVRITYYINVQTYADENFYTKEKVDELLKNVEATVEVDAELSETSENPVQNKVITQELASYATTAEVESKVTEKVAEIVAGAPERYNTLKELADWIDSHEDSAASMNSAIQQNKKDVSTANTNITKNAEDIETANENIAKNVDEITAVRSDVAINKSTLGTQSYNLLKTSAKANITRSGLTFKAQSDGSVKVTGTATASTSIDIYVAGDWQSMNVLYPSNNYRIHLKHDTNTAMTITVLSYDGTSQHSVWVSGSDVSKTLTNYITGIYITFRPETGVTYDNYIYSMLTYADVVSADYMPYQSNIHTRLTNVETSTSDAKSQAAINRTTLGVQHKNLLPYRCVPHSNSGGIKVAVAEDGVVTLSGTNTKSFTYNINFATPMKFDRDVFIVGAEKLSNVLYNCKVDTAVNGSQYPTIGTVGLRIPAGTTIAYLYFQQTTAGKEIEATIAPMIVYADVLDRTYEPYKPSLQEQINTLLARIEALEATTTEGGE